MNYDEQQGVAYAVGKLYDLLDKHAGEEIPKDAIRDLIKELEDEYDNQKGVVMTKEEFNAKMDKIYFAIRQTEGYTDAGDELVDFVVSLANIAEDDLVE